MASTLDRNRLIAAGIAITALTTYTIFRISKIPPRSNPNIIPSPRTTLLPNLTKDQISSLPYPPDALPGSRDISTPHGSMRIYEYGPETGRKVLFIHGDATPSPMFRDMMNDLVAKGCRVMTFDLWGRGYTDTPADLKHDCALYTRQIYYALTSSDVKWTPGRFSLVGFSMGGSIALDFFRHNPSPIEGLILLGPGGLIRKLPAEYTNFFYQYPSLISKGAMRRLLGTCLGVDMSKSAANVQYTDSGFTPSGAVQFQFDHHQGHLISFLSNIQYGPIVGQHQVWEEAGKVVKGGESGLQGGKVLVVCGANDDVVLAEHVQEDMSKYFGEENFDFKTVPGGHGFPWSEGSKVGEIICDFWGL